MKYVIGRNHRGRPSLQHKTDNFTSARCGTDIGTWSRAFSNNAIPQVLCKKCKKL